MAQNKLLLNIHPIAQLTTVILQLNGDDNQLPFVSYLIEADIRENNGMGMLNIKIPMDCVTITESSYHPNKNLNGVDSL